MLCILHRVDTGLEATELDAADASAWGVVMCMGFTFSANTTHGWATIHSGVVKGFGEG